MERALFRSYDHCVKAPGWAAPVREVHADQWELCATSAGCTVASVEGRQYDVGAVHLGLVAPGREHTCATPAGATLHTMHFSAAAFEALADEIGLVRGGVSEKVLRTPAPLTSTLETLRREHSLERPAAALMIDGVTLQLAVLLLR